MAGSKDTSIRWRLDGRGGEGELLKAALRKEYPYYDLYWERQGGVR